MIFRERRNSNRFKELAYPHAEFIYNMALRFTGNSSDAEDITQETFYTAFKNFHQLREKGKCKYWLLAILRNLYFRESSRNGRKNEVLAGDEESYADLLEKVVSGEQNPEEAIAKEREEQQVREIIKRVPEKYKTPLILYYMEEMTYQEISAAIEIPIGTVMSRLSRARGYLKREMIRENLESETSGKVLKPDFGRSERLSGRL